ncbi:Tubulin-specific chaperone E [Psilocybe cubensis]|uniref:Tubulin-specific chaperone E n=2 Tax=Psilocybe cubensis TaxID=181762 RepID=A0ACB8H8B8_PSICU|nr:Tubulin-specific chaperone E [Psilocybe cubensis]KAH9483960.1 Tubulin-specific chaperone E [Psilocybe cubensis]
MSPSIPSLGTRFSLNNDIGTIRYTGPVGNTPGIWLGVEWDDPGRGRHDGSKDGTRYFSCRFASAGSFIRPNQHIQYGVTFLDALTAKYIEPLHGSDEIVTLGSSQGAIQVTAVSLDKIRDKFSRLDRLREVSLDKATVVQGDPPADITKTCPNIRGLDLSQNLLPNWETVADITGPLFLLERLSLSRNRLQMPLNYDRLATAFQRLTEIQLNDTLISWSDMQTITAFMPQLRVIELGYNHLSRLCGDKRSTAFKPNLESLNLDTNACSDWMHICDSFREYDSLQRVVLTSNHIEDIPFPESSSNCLPGIKYLSLSDNRISSWETIDALSCWLPSLETLMMNGNPLMNDNDLGTQSRPFMIARVPSLVTLDGAFISSRERTDSELFYMSTIIQQGNVADDVRAKTHYRWPDLCKKYGKPDQVQKQKNVQNKLSDHLIDLQVYPYDKSMEQSSGAFASNPQTTLRVLPTMSFRVLRLKICKILKVDYRRTNVAFWLHMGNGTLTKLDKEHDLRDLDWLGVDSGSQIVYQVQ